MKNIRILVYKILFFLSFAGIFSALFLAVSGHSGFSQKIIAISFYFLIASSVFYLFNLIYESE